MKILAPQRHSRSGKYFLPLLLVQIALAVPCLAADEAKPPVPTFEAAAYGAKGDGTTLNTTSLQAAIDAASKAGGGVVHLAPGSYVSGSLVLKSHVELHLDRGATLLGSTSRADYPHDNWSALLQADGQDDVKITGHGVIDGQGLPLAKDVMRRTAQGEFGAQSDKGKESRMQSLLLPDADFSQKTIGIRPSESDRPMLLKLTNCHNAEVSGVTLQNSSGWVALYDRCQDLVIKNIRVDSTVYWNNDGIDLTDCRNVKISGCDINSADDGICLKSGASGPLGQGEEHSMNSSGCENVEVTDCRVRSSASAFKMGTASFGGFRKIHVSNLTVYNTYRSTIALECVDGGTVDDVVIENVTAVNVGCAIFMKLGQRNKKAPIGVFQNVIVRNVKAWVAAGKPDLGYGTVVPNLLAPNVLPSAIVGLPDHPVRNVRLENIEIFHPGGADPKKAQVSTDKLSSVPENAGSYPEISMFGELPAWGFYVRHAEGIQFSNVHLFRDQADYRPALVCDDVRQMGVFDTSVYPEIKTPDVFLQNVHEVNFGEVEKTNLTAEKVHSGPDSTVITGLK